MKRFFIILAATAVASLSLDAQSFKGMPKTIREFLDMSASDTTTCMLTGVVTKVTSNAGNLFIKDETAEVYLYGVVDPKRPNFGFRQMDIKAGDTLTVSGRRTVFRDIVEMTSARLVSKSNGPDHDAPMVLDKEPNFKGRSGDEADEAFVEWVQANLKRPAGYENAHATVKVQFVVGTNGGVQEVQVIKSTDRHFNAEAVRVVSSSPKWKPAVLEGKPFRTRHRINVEF